MLTSDAMGIFTNTLVSGFAFGLVVLLILPDKPDDHIPRWVSEVIRWCLLLIFLGESLRHGYLAYREVYDLPTPSQAHPIAIGANIVMVFAYPPLLVIGAWLKWKIIRWRYRG